MAFRQDAGSTLLKRLLSPGGTTLERLDGGPTSRRRTQKNCRVSDGTASLPWYARPAGNPAR